MTHRQTRRSARTISAEKAKNEAQLAEIAQINRDIKALQDVRAELEKKVSQLATKVVERDKSIPLCVTVEGTGSQTCRRTGTHHAGAERNGEKNLTIRELSAQAERIGDDLTKEQRASQDAQTSRNTERQLTALRQQLVRLNAALEASEAKAAAQTVQIVSLGKRLNSACKQGQNCAVPVRIFRTAAQAVGNHGGIRIVGDRFVFQSKSCSRQDPQA